MHSPISLSSTFPTYFLEKTDFMTMFHLLLLDYVLSPNPVPAFRETRRLEGAGVRGRHFPWGSGSGKVFSLKTSHAIWRQLRLYFTIITFPLSLSQPGKISALYHGNLVQFQFKALKLCGFLIF